MRLQYKKKKKFPPRKAFLVLLRRLKKKRKGKKLLKFLLRKAYKVKRRLFFSFSKIYHKHSFWAQRLFFRKYFKKLKITSFFYLPPKRSILKLRKALARVWPLALLKKRFQNSKNLKKKFFSNKGVSFSGLRKFPFLRRPSNKRRHYSFLSNNYSFTYFRSFFFT